jgi:arylsulfatase A-like enzyme
VIVRLLQLKERGGTAVQIHRRSILLLFAVVTMHSIVGTSAGVCLAVDLPHTDQPNTYRPNTYRPNTDQPNIVWLIVEDMSADFSCYGQQDIRTPHVDDMAAGGIRFSRAFVTAPICSISRSALITGRYQTSIGAQNHRSSVPGHEIRLPKDVTPIPVLFRNAGYHTNNLAVEEFLRSDPDVRRDAAVRVAKTDYNFVYDPASLYDSVHWSVRDAGKPFFVQIQLRGGKLRGHGDGDKWPAQVKEKLGSVTAAETVRLPPWLPDDTVIRRDWAQYLDTVRYTDYETGLIIQRLKDAGEYDRTVICLMTDHGVSHIRTKQFLYDGGIHVPLIVRGPGIPSGVVRDDLTEHIDLAAVSLGLAGIPLPEWMYAKDVLAKDYRPRDYVFAARDRADETVDLIRCVRDTRWKYIVNGFPNRPYLQPNNYKDNKPIVRQMRMLFAAGQLNRAQSLILAETRPREELYDTLADPFELNNLAGTAGGPGASEYSERLIRMRSVLSDWQSATGDLAQPESEDVYRIETAARHQEAGKNSAEDQYHRNVELMLRWMKERPPVH